VNWLIGIRIALRALRVNKLRSLLTMLGIIIGVAAVITMIAIGSGAQAQIEEQIDSLGSNMIVINAGAYSGAGVRMGTGSRVVLTEEDANALEREVPDLEAAAPALHGFGQVVFANNNWATILHGVTPEYFEVRHWPVVSGKAFDAADVNDAAKLVVLGDTVVQRLFGGSDPVGAVIRVRKVPMQVIGVLERKGMTPHGTDQDDVVLMPITTARNRVIGGNGVKLRTVGSISLKLSDGADREEVMADMRTVLRERHRLQPAQDDDFTVSSLADLLTAREESTRTMTLLLAAVASVSLLVGGIGIMNIMLVSVTERTREIGLRMAVGARGCDILSQFLVEAVTLALVGGACGVVLGIAGAYAIGHFAGWPTDLDIGAILLAAGFAASVGVFFGFYPARKASRLMPIEALRYE
jgi:putative ABC transport system permease protein